MRRRARSRGRCRARGARGARSRSRCPDRGRRRPPRPAREEFDQWATSGKDRGMEDRHWHTAKHVLARMPVEAG
ncbi:hypothetical protein DJ75_08825, partial [Halorubrum sp. Eb13]